MSTNTVRLTDTAALARVLEKDVRTIARWCADGDIECSVRGHGVARRYHIVVRNDVVIVCGVEITVR